MRFSTLASSFILAAATLAAADDLTLVSQQTRGDAAPVTTTSYFTSQKMRSGGARGEDVIFDYASGTMTVLDSGKKEYFVITSQDMEAASAQMAAKTKEMEGQMQNVPPEMRERIAAMTGGGMAANVEVQKGTGGRTIAGYSCQNWIVTMGKMMHQESCVATDVPIPVGAFDGMKKFAQGMGAVGPMGKGLSQMWEKFKEMKGYPLATKSTVSIMGKDMVSTMEVTEVKKGAIPASAFEIPAGYKKVDSPMAKMGQTGKRK